MTEALAVIMLIAVLAVAGVVGTAVFAMYRLSERPDHADGYARVAESAARAVGEAVAAATAPILPAVGAERADSGLDELEDGGIGVDEADWTVGYIPDRVSGASVGVRMPDGSIMADLSGEELVIGDEWDGVM